MNPITELSPTTHQLTAAPIARTELLIRKPVRQVFEAFVEPAVTSRFWFTKSSGRLEPGRHVKWDWEMYGVSVQVTVKALELNRRIQCKGRLANRSSLRARGPTFALRATVGNLRLSHERRLVDQTFPSWNRVADWLKEAERFSMAA